MATAPAAPEVNVGDFPYEFRVVSISEMFVDDSYQRPLTSFVDRIIKNYDPALVGTLVLSFRDDGRRTQQRYAVVDGQTRMEGMRELGILTAPAVVFYDLTRQQEAQLFAKLQKERRGIASFHRFRAAFVGGEEEPKAIMRIATGAGYVIGIDDKRKQISAVAALEKVYRRSPELLERTLLILKEAWRDRHMPNGEVIRGMGYFLDRNENVDDDRMASRLSTISPEELKRRSSALREGAGHGGGSERYMAGAIEGVYRAPRRR